MKKLKTLYTFIHNSIHEQAGPNKYTWKSVHRSEYRKKFSTDSVV